MKGLIVAVAALVMGPAAMAGAQTTAPPLSAEATKSFADFENFGPHRAFVVGPDGKAAWWRAWAARTRAMRSPRR
jgi:hypothetical protein